MWRQGCFGDLRPGALALFAELTLTALLSAAGAESIVVAVDRPAFDPAIGERVTFAVQLRDAGKLTFQVCDTTHSAVKTLVAGESREAGGHAFVWDGRLNDGELAVPGTAYYPLLEVVGPEGGLHVFDPAPSGGRAIVLSERECRYDARAGGLKLALPVPVRLLVRVGVRDGPILATLSSWSSFPAGEANLAWDGWDNAHLVDVARHRAFVLATQAIALPEPCVTVRGLSPLTSLLPSGKSATPERKLALQRALFAQPVPVASGYVTLPAVEVPPAIGMAIRARTAKTAEESSSNPYALTVDVSPGPFELERLASDRFEVVACIDLVPVAEDEIGKLPCTMLVPLRGVAPGTHLLSISV